ncbi:Precorrin-8X methylmutase CbiC/CobH [Dethiosulfovibrio peptidovorans DSM 11002]|uniref:Precorrin-8X methylmutase CbiC/CobH n=1 Tax=Dethiosulfovibrio peptidovorans DSM 11002 TaxID=469381 RepID=D2Z8F6_9BACT|nr:precorrin-8X methylmutase [Dethiosulfovibrio peptidovorans]EFC91753.1 Precorrin-8X methylmutase CbiC/CobH [Dethiosulfovibrio peptidovorans DSM 11002]
MTQRFMAPADIEAKSFRILQEKMGPFYGTKEELAIVTRVAHATADVDFGMSLYIHAGAIKSGLSALRSGAPVITDVEMVRAGIRKDGLESMGGRVLTFLNDPEVAEMARNTENATRSQMAMRKALPHMEGAIVAIGNAPTALFEIIDRIKAKEASPALVIGMPIGFVGAAESHQELIELDYPSITAPGPKGGSPVAAAIVNALIKLALRP